MPITFNYSSKVWRADSYREMSSGFPNYYADVIYGEHSSSGWTSSLRALYLEDSNIVKIISTSSGGDPGTGGCPYVGAPGCGSSGGGSIFTNSAGFSCNGACTCTIQLGFIHQSCPPRQTSPTPSNPSQNNYYIIPKKTLHLPDGSTHELVVAITPIYVSSGAYPPDFTTYFSIDGSNLLYELSPPSGIPTLYLPDGSRYEFTGDGTNVNQQLVLYFDRNGNKTVYRYNPTLKQGEWKDTMGRTVPVPKVSTDAENPYSLSPGDVDYYVPSLPNQPIKYTFKWKRLADSFPVDSFPAGSVYTVKNTADLFANLRAGEPHNPVVLQEIVQPNGQSYRFDYNEYGEIEKITYPSGAVEQFSYAAIPQFGYAGRSIENQLQAQGNRGVVQRRVRPNGNSTGEMRWQYGVPLDPQYPNRLRALPPYRVVTTAPDNSKTEKYLYLEAVSSGGPGEPRLPSQLAGKVYEERAYSTSGALAARTLTEWNTSGSTPTIFGSPAPYLAQNPKVLRRTSIVIENGKALTQSQTFDYDNYNNVTRETSFDFLPLDLTTAENAAIGSIPFGSALKTSQTTYKTDSVYTSRQMVSMPETTTLRNGDANGAVIAQTETVYDEPGYGILTNGSLTGDTAATWVDPNNAYRGNPTTARVWNSDANAWIATHAQFDQYGNLRKAWDASGDANRFVETEYSANYAFAYPTKVITPAPDPTDTHGTNQTTQATSEYDFNTGLPVKATDDYGQTIKTEYDDYLRPKKVSGENVTVPISETIYNDAPGDLWVKVKKQIDQNNWDEATSYTDGIGRTIKTKSKDSQGDVVARTEYDDKGRIEKVSSPYRVDGSGNAVETVYWTKTKYDELGRAEESFAPAVDVASAQSTGKIAYEFATAGEAIGTVVTTTDAAGRKSRSITNALGQLIRVDEPSSNNELTALPVGTPAPTPSPTPTSTPGGGSGGGGGCNPNTNRPCQSYATAADGSYASVSTYYKYNAQGKMVAVEQGGQTRYFKYDSLGRLIRVRQPEQETNAGFDLADSYNQSGNWSAKFTYDNLGNVKTATDAKGVTITNDYDNLNRVVQRSYSNEPAGQTTPQVDYYYDGVYYDASNTKQQAAGSAKGALTQTRSSISSSQTIAFDNFGRAKTYQQTTDGKVYTSTYEYNLSGQLVKQTYPSGRVVVNSFESDGDLASIGSRVANGQFRNYASNFSYTAAGVIERLQLGNGRWETAKLNSRQQITELALGTSQTDTSLWKVNYEYGEIDANGNVNTAKNDGNIAKQTISFAGLAQPFVQTYKYDSVNRLTEARETSGSSTNQTWIQQFNYDRYGNRIGFNQTVGSQPLVLDNKTFPQIDQATNRFANGQNYLYDKNGNVTKDADERHFYFNGDNKQTQVITSGGSVVGQYFYDGDGKRVKKVGINSQGNQETTIFVYSGRQLVAEYSTATPPTNPTTSYTATDPLGSPRVITNAQGEVISRRDFMPFGEELYPDQQYRKSTDKYGAVDSVRQRFTGYQKDVETGLDFAEARYYNNQHGRFTAVDPLLASGKSANPQTFNRYSYTMNRPLKLTDKSGMQAGVEEDDVMLYVHTIWDKITNTFWEPSKDARNERANYLLNGATNISPLDKVNYRQLQNVLNASKGDTEAMNSLDERLVGNQGPTVSSVLQQTNDGLKLAQTINEWSLTVQLGLLTLNPAGYVGGSSSVTTNRGFSVPRFAGAEVSETAGSIRSVNPFGCQTNCVNTSIATDATLAGRPASALRSGITPTSALETTFNGRFTPMTQQQITTTLTNGGNGSRGIILGGRFGAPGHVFNGVNQNGNIRFLDGQTGTTANWAGYNFFRFLPTN